MSRRLQGFKKRLSDIDAEIAAAESQLSTINDDVEYRRREKALDTLYYRYDEIEAKIQEIENQLQTDQNTTTNLEVALDKNIGKNLISLDYCQPKQYFGKISSQVKKTGGAAALLLNEAHRLQGNIFTQHIEDTLTTQGHDIQAFPIEFAPGEPKNKDALLAKILGYLGESSSTAPEDAIAKICQSLQIGSIRVFKIYNWDEIHEPYAVLKWFLDEFWLPLIECCQRHCQQEQLVKVQLFALIICQADDPEILKQPYYAEHDTYDPCNVRCDRSIVHLPLSCWTEEEIRNWMYCFPPPKYTRNLTAIQDLAKRFHRRTKGIPIDVVDLILKEYQNHTDNETMEAG